MMHHVKAYKSSTYIIRFLELYHVASIWQLHVEEELLWWSVWPLFSP
jgi:hypothetical protein